MPTDRIDDDLDDATETVGVPDGEGTPLDEAGRSHHVPLGSPYLWRYREQLGDEEMDLLFLTEPSDGFVEDNPGEVRIIHWQNHLDQL